MACVGLVLAGGASRGAYEVGVVRHVLEDVARTLGCDVPIDVLCGTSAGSINACMLAAHADQPRARGAMLANGWTNLTVGDVVRPSAGEMLYLGARVLGLTARGDTRLGRRGGLFDPKGVEAVIRRGTPFHRIAEHMSAGRLRALSISTTL